MRANLSWLLTITLFGVPSCNGPAGEVKGGRDCFAQLFTPSTVFSNCGFNVCVFALAFFGRGIDPQEVISELEISESLQKACSFTGLGRALASRGLTVAAYKGATIDDVAANLNGDTLAIVQIHGGVNAHLIAVSKHGESFDLFNFPHPVHSVSRDRLNHLLRPGMTGNIVWVSSKPLALVETRPNPTITLEPTVPSPPGNVDGPPLKGARESGVASTGGQQDGACISIPLRIALSVDDSNEDMVSAQLPVKNRGNHAIQIKKITGSCTCFSDYSVPAERIEPGTASYVTLHFRRSRFNFSNGTTVAVESDDEALPAVIVQVGVSPIAAKLERALIVPYRTVNLGKLSREEAAQTTVCFPILSRTNEQKVNLEVVAEPSELKIERCPAQLELQQEKLHGELFCARFSAPVGGPFRHVIKVRATVADFGQRSISLVVEGVIDDQHL